jgi:D-amino-acid oxidase
MQQLTGHRAAAHAPRLACCRFSTPQRRPASRLTCRARSGSSTLDGMFKPWNNYAEYDSDDTPRVLVVGAGVAGLTTAVRRVCQLAPRAVCCTGWPRAVSAALVGRARHPPHPTATAALTLALNTSCSPTRLLDELRGVRIIVVADKYGSDTTTHGAAGVWMPFKLSDTPQDLIDECVPQCVPSTRARARAPPCCCSCLLLLLLQVG